MKSRDYAGGGSKLEIVHNNSEGEEYQLITSPMTHTQTDVAVPLPPHYALLYIMKL